MTAFIFRENPPFIQLISRASGVTFDDMCLGEAACEKKRGRWKAKPVAISNAMAQVFLRGLLFTNRIGGDESSAMNDADLQLQDFISGIAGAQPPGEARRREQRCRSFSGFTLQTTIVIFENTGNARNALVLQRYWYSTKNMKRTPPLRSALATSMMGLKILR